MRCCDMRAMRVCKKWVKNLVVVAKFVMCVSWGGVFVQCRVFSFHFVAFRVHWAS